MPYIDPKVVLEAKKMNLLTLLKNFEPHELVRLDKNNYTTRTHDSLKISNGKWMWFSRGIGGTTALNYLIEVKGYSFIEVVETITGKQVVVAPKPIKQEINIMKDHFYYSGSVHYKMIRFFVLTTEPLYSIMEMK